MSPFLSTMLLLLPGPLQEKKQQQNTHQPRFRELWPVFATTREDVEVRTKLGLPFGFSFSLGCLSLWLLLPLFLLAPASSFLLLPAAAQYPELWGPWRTRRPSCGLASFLSSTAPGRDRPNLWDPVHFPTPSLIPPPAVLLGWTHDHTRVWKCGAVCG